MSLCVVLRDTKLNNQKKSCKFYLHFSSLKFGECASISPKSSIIAIHDFDCKRLGYVAGNV